MLFRSPTLLIAVVTVVACYGVVSAFPNLEVPPDSHEEGASNKICDEELLQVLEAFRNCEPRSIPLSWNRLSELPWDGIYALTMTDPETKAKTSMITKIIVGDKKLSCRSINWGALPRHLAELILPHNKIAGTLDASQLPEQLVMLDLSFNALEGHVNWKELPQTLVSLSLASNRFKGLIDLSELTPTLHTIAVMNNQFSGPLLLKTLPRRVVYADFTNNQLDGPLDLTTLPTSLQYLFLSGNDFSGTVDLTKLPESLTAMHLFGNSELQIPAINKAQLPPKMKWISTKELGVNELEDQTHFHSDSPEDLAKFKRHVDGAPLEDL